MFILYFFMITTKLRPLDRSDLHLSSFSGVPVAFPGVPVHAISIGLVCAMVVQAVKVRVMTVCVPPGTLVRCSTVTTMAVIVTIFSGERYRQYLEGKVLNHMNDQRCL